MKPGWQTSEFWLTAAMQIIGLLVVVGVIAVGDKATVEGAVAEGIKAIFALATNALVLWKYIQSRGEVKVEAAKWDNGGGK